MLGEILPSGIWPPDPARLTAIAIAAVDHICERRVLFLGSKNSLSFERAELSAAETLPIPIAGESM